MQTKLLILLMAGACFGCNPNEQSPTTVTSSSVPSSSVASTVTSAAETPAAIPQTMPASSITDSAVSSAVSGTIEMVDTYWRLVGLNGQDISSPNKEREPHIIFAAENNVSGSDGCNRFKGSYEINGDSLSLGQLVSTRMACADEKAHMQGFTEALAQARSFEVEGKILNLHNDAGEVIAQFSAMPRP